MYYIYVYVVASMRNSFITPFSKCAFGHASVLSSHRYTTFQFSVA